ncbi:MAG: Cof-type HAD-IIB family hydrolase [Carnobacterium alterfunditum]
MNKKLIALDLDGTTLNNRSEISVRTQNTLKTLRNAGHLVSIVTGRPYRNSKQFYTQLGMKTPIVNFNGALCHLPDQLNWKSQYHKTLNREIALDMLTLKKELNIHLIAAELRDTVFADNYFVPYNGFFPEGSKGASKLTASSLKEDPTAVCVFTDAENQAYIIEKISARYGDTVEIRTWGGQSPCLEIVAAGVQKALGVERIAQVYGIKQKDIIAFGDEDNDYEMIQYAGHGVVMKNGIDTLKHISNDVTEKTNNEDGLAHYLENYFGLV